MIMQPEARPSRPSVMLQAFDVATIQNHWKATKTSTPAVSNAPRESGSSTSSTARPGRRPSTRAAGSSP